VRIIMPSTMTKVALRDSVWACWQQPVAAAIAPSVWSRVAEWPYPLQKGPVHVMSVAWEWLWLLG
jgi:hypothetical protein